MKRAIREVFPSDLDELLDLYTHLHETDVPPDTAARAALWERLLKDPCYHIIVAEAEGRLLSSCTLVVVPNLTRDLRPYGLIENVVTRREERKRGLASACLDRARELAREAGCYKLMLLTGAKNAETLRFYERAGYNCQDKTAFVQWL